MRVAVTGATGFIGRHVVRELAKCEGVEITAVSRRPPEPNVLPATVQAVCMDIAAPSARDFEALRRPDALIHLAWSGLPNYKSLHHFETHLGEQYRFLAGLIEGGLPSLFCTGTCFEYGMQSGELDEELVPDPQNPYGFAKDALRRELGFLRAVRSFQFTWGRLFYMYGDGQPPTALYSQLMAAGRSGSRSFRMSGGEQLRDYSPVTDIAATIVALALDVPDAGIVNICSGRPTSVRSMVEQWIGENGWTMGLELGYHPYPDYEPFAFWGSRRRLKCMLARASTSSSP